MTKREIKSWLIDFCNSKQSNIKEIIKYLSLSNDYLKISYFINDLINIKRLVKARKLEQARTTFEKLTTIL